MGEWQPKAASTAAAGTAVPQPAAELGPTGEGDVWPEPPAGWLDDPGMAWTPSTA